MKPTKIFYIGFAFLLVVMGVILFALQEDPDSDSPPSLKLGSALYKGLARSAYHELNNNNFEELKSKFEEDNEDATNLNAGAQYLHLNDNTFSTLDLNPAQGFPLEKLFDCISQEAGGAIFAQYKEGKWQLYPALTEDEGVETISDAGAYKIYPGEGFILILKSEAEAYCLKTSNTPSDGSVPTLSTGWNLIGVNEENLAAALPDREDIGAVWYLNDFEGNLEFLRASKEEFADITLEHYLVWVKILSEGQIRTLNLEKLRAAKVNAFCAAFPLGLLESDGSFKQNEAAFDLVKSSFVEQDLDLEDVADFPALEKYVRSFNFSWADFYDQEYVDQIRECAPDLVDSLYPEFAGDEFKQRFVDAYVAGYCTANNDGYFDENAPEFIAKMTEALRTNDFDVANSRQELDKFLDRFNPIYNNGNWRDKVNQGIATCVEPQQENIVDTYVKAYCGAYQEGLFDEESAAFKNKIVAVFGEEGYNVSGDNLDESMAQIDNHFNVDDAEEAQLEAQIKDRIQQCKDAIPIKDRYKAAVIFAACGLSLSPNDNFDSLDFDKNPAIQERLIRALNYENVNVNSMEEVKALSEQIFNDENEEADEAAFQEIIDEIDKCHPGYKAFMNGEEPQAPAPDPAPAPEPEPELEGASVEVIITFIPGTREAEQKASRALKKFTNIERSKIGTCIGGLAYLLPCIVGAENEEKAKDLIAAINALGGEAKLLAEPALDPEAPSVDADEILVDVVMTGLDNRDKEDQLISAIMNFEGLSRNDVAQQLLSLINYQEPITILSNVPISEGEGAQQILKNLGAEITLLEPRGASIREISDALSDALGPSPEPSRGASIREILDVALPPQPPQNFKISGFSNHVVLDWEAPEMEGVDEYRILFGDNNNGLNTTRVLVDAENGIANTKIYQHIIEDIVVPITRKGRPNQKMYPISLQTIYEDGRISEPISIPFIVRSLPVSNLSTQISPRNVEYVIFKWVMPDLNSYDGLTVAEYRLDIYFGEELHESKAYEGSQHFQRSFPEGVPETVTGKLYTIYNYGTSSPSIDRAASPRID